MSYGRWPRYVSVAEKKARAEKKLARLRKKQPDIQPVVLAGNALATTWWGKAWNRNLEGYADYSNRIGRGRSYVRHGFVADLRIEPGRITSLVLGTDPHPYRVEVKIKAMNRKNWQRIVARCQGGLSSLTDLLAGRFPREFQDVFMVQGTGLFPAPKEIDFHCSCPDWATMCKHVAATLYGVGARLDQDPGLFFTLRQVDVNDLVGQVVEQRADAILEGRPELEAERVIGDDRLGELFGIDLDDFDPDADLGMPRAGRDNKTVGTGQQRPARRNRKAGTRATSRSRRAPSRDDDWRLPEGYGSATALVEGCLAEMGEEGMSVADLSGTTGIPRSRLYPLLARLKRQGRVVSVSRGIYRAAG